MDQPLDAIIKKDRDERKKSKKVIKKKGAKGFKRDSEKGQRKFSDPKWKRFVERNSRQSGTQRKENPARDPKNVRVSGLGKHIKNGEIRQLFEQIGDVEFAQMITDSKGEKIGKAVVWFRNPEKHNRHAIKEYNGAELDKQRITVEYDN